MFRVGDYVYYGGDGVCRIEKIAQRKLPGEAEVQLYYTFQPICDKYVIHTPVHGSKNFVRKVISREEADRLIDLIPSLQVDMCNNLATNRLKVYYEESLQTHSCAELTKLIKSIRAKKKIAERQRRKLGAVDTKYLALAEELLFSELSIALGISMDEVSAYIESKLKVTEG